MKYPRQNHFLSIERIHRDQYAIKNMVTGEEWEASAVYARFLKKLDGKTDPYHIFPRQLSREDVDELLEDMKREQLLEDRCVFKFNPLGFGSVTMPFWIPRVTVPLRLLGALWNKMLMLVFLPYFLFGVHIFLSGDWHLIDHGDGGIGGYVLGMILGMLLHEWSHAAACIGYSAKNRFFEMGLCIHHFFPAAYVAMDYSQMKNHLKRAQINAAGIESNLLLSGMFFSFLKLGRFDSAMLLVAGIVNLVLAVLNLVLIRGIDGMQVVQELFAGEEFVERAKALVVNKKSKKALRRRGVNGRATVAVSYIVLLLQGLLPIFLAMEIISTLSVLLS